MDEIYSLSFGAGVQSTALLMLTLNKDQRLFDALGGHWPDLACFADTGAEPSYVYEHLGKMVELCKEKDFRLDMIQFGDIADDMLGIGKGADPKRFAAAPLFTRNADSSVGMLRRQCTREYKITPIHNHIKRTILGMKPFERMKTKLVSILGISVDEMGRAKESQNKWERMAYPLLDMRWRRADCIKYLQSIGMGQVKKSACVFCPYRSTTEWRIMKKHHPEDFEKAVQFDESVRHLHKKKRGGIKNEIYVHKSCEPLGEQTFGEEQVDLWDSWEDECDGVCGL